MNQLPKLLLHSCCAPCSSAVLERLAQDWQLVLFYYNPNLDTPWEFRRRAEELDKLRQLGIAFKVIVADYHPEAYDSAVQGLEDLGEGSRRCYNCYELRLRKTAQVAKAGGYSAFTTTLTVSPHKKSAWVSELGQKLAAEYGVEFLDQDFKKQAGYQRSLELSQKLGLYRQNYCGCRYSKAEAAERQARSSSSRAPAPK